MSEDRQEHEDRGSGYVTIVLDHGTGSARLGYDNVTPEEMVALANVLRGTAASLLKEQERERMREEIRREIEGDRKASTEKPRESDPAGS